MVTEAPRFAVDRTLGRLARWLRLLGFDAVRRMDMTGQHLLTLAARERRVLLTRDRKLARHPGTVRVLCLESDRFRDQLREVDRAIPLGGIEGRAARCGDCNRELDPVALADLPATVPAYVRATQSAFLRCPGCRKIFWEATHRERMRAEVAALSLTPAQGY